MTSIPLKNPVKHLLQRESPLPKTNNSSKILVTSALPYANGSLHLGHLAGAYLPADVFVRYHRQMQNDVVYICGTDEHGVPITIKAEREGKTAQEIVDFYYAEMKEDFAGIGISFDNFSRTSLPIHHQTASEFFTILKSKNYLTQKTSLQLYCEHDKMFLPDRYVEGICHHCQSEGARGDQCDVCGNVIDPLKLGDPRCQLCGNSPVQRETSHWYIRLQDFEVFLKEWIGGKKHWKDNVKRFCSELLEKGLQERAVTRDLNWGVPVPGEPDGKVLYVWFDAPIGYISSTKEWASKIGKPERWKDYWQDAENTRLVHFIGKDNIIFHAIMFPAMLQGADSWVLPENVPANEFLNLEGNKLSTSKNYAVWVRDYLKEFAPDSLRYCLAINAPESRDTDFSWKEFQARHNNELADILGNFINRSVTFVHKYFDGKVPPLTNPDAEDSKMLEMLAQAPAKIGQLFDNYQVKEGTLQIMNVARAANKYFNDKAPWKARKENIEIAGNTLHICLETARTLAIIARPVLPFTAEKIWKLFVDLPDIATVHWNDAGKPALSEAMTVAEPEILFSKIEDDAVQRQIDRLEAIAKDIFKPKENKSLQPTVPFSHFASLDIRLVQIKSAEKVKKADKLLKLVVNDGEKDYQIVAGIAKSYDPDELPGKTVAAVLNLEPAKIKGIESQGMLLAAENGEVFSLLQTEKQMPAGARVK
jgi:methionyl-tRNA synthetase